MTVIKINTGHDRLIDRWLARLEHDVNIIKSKGITRKFHILQAMKNRGYVIKYPETFFRIYFRKYEPKFIEFVNYKRKDEG